MGSASDLPIVKKAIDTLDNFGVSYEVHVFSAHRTPWEAAAFAASAKERGFGVLIAAAGMAAHLAGALAAQTLLPVIGIPVKSGAFEGKDALLSTVQMPSGVPVAAVAVDGAANAAILACEILALGEPDLYAKLEKMRADNRKACLEKDAEISAEFRKND